MTEQEYDALKAKYGRMPFSLYYVVDNKIRSLYIYLDFDGYGDRAVYIHQPILNFFQHMVVLPPEQLLTGGHSGTEYSIHYSDNKENLLKYLS